MICQVLGKRCKQQFVSGNLRKGYVTPRLRALLLQFPMELMRRTGPPKGKSTWTSAFKESGHLRWSCATFFWPEPSPNCAHGSVKRKKKHAPLTSQLTKPPPGSFRRVCCSRGSARSRQGADAVGQRLGAAQRHEDVLKAASRQHVFPCIWVGLEQPCFIVTKNGLDEDPENCNKESSVNSTCLLLQQGSSSPLDHHQMFLKVHPQHVLNAFLHVGSQEKSPGSYGVARTRLSLLIGWLLVGWLIACLLACWIDWLVGWLAGCSLMEWFIDWLNDRLTMPNTPAKHRVHSVSNTGCSFMTSPETAKNCAMLNHFETYPPTK